MKSVLSGIAGCLLCLAGFGLWIALHDRILHLPTWWGGQGPRSRLIFSDEAKWIPACVASIGWGIVIALQVAGSPSLKKIPVAVVLRRTATVAMVTAAVLLFPLAIHVAFRPTGLRWVSEHPVILLRQPLPVGIVQLVLSAYVAAKLVVTSQARPVPANHIKVRVEIEKAWIATTVILIALLLLAFAGGYISSVRAYTSSAMVLDATASTAGPGCGS